VRSGTASSRLEQIRAFESLTQRGKGGVYRALDLTARPIRPCILKEGRRSGEQEWDGRDGRWRVRHEAHVLRELAANGVPVATVYECFEAGPHAYICLEELDGDLLTDSLRRGRRLPWPIRLRTALDVGAKLAVLLNDIHAAGWLWRDCKPTNLIVSGDGLRPLDFEGACSIDDPDTTPWGSPAYSPPSDQRTDGAASRHDDRYALAATLYHLLVERPPAVGGPLDFGRLRRFIPGEVKALVHGLASQDGQLSFTRIAEQLAAAAARIKP
jgi:serine/threonine protein kinase